MRAVGVLEVFVAGDDWNGLLVLPRLALHGFTVAQQQVNNELQGRLPVGRLTQDQNRCNRRSHGVKLYVDRSHIRNENQCVYLQFLGILILGMFLNNPAIDANDMFEKSEFCIDTKL